MALAVVVAALAISAVGAPASAFSETHLAIVQGIPGVKVDFCVDGTEVNSRVRYGGRKFVEILNSDPVRITLKSYAKDPRKCKGTLLAKKRVDLDVNDDLTIVVTKRAPKVLVFDNSILGTLPAAEDMLMSFRHAADIGRVTFHSHVFAEVFPPGPLDPAADPRWKKGDKRDTVADAAWLSASESRDRTRPGPSSVPSRSRPGRTDASK